MDHVRLKRHNPVRPLLQDLGRGCVKGIKMPADVIASVHHNHPVGVKMTSIPRPAVQSARRRVAGPAAVVETDIQIRIPEILEELEIVDVVTAMRNRVPEKCHALVRL